MMENGVINDVDAMLEKEKDPILAFDLCLRLLKASELPRADSERVEKRIFRSILMMAGRDVDNVSDFGEELLGALSDEMEPANKKLVGVCFLRLLQGPAIQWISKMPWRPKVIAVLDSQFARDVYWEKRMHEGLQAHEKVERLAVIVQECERKYQEALQMLTSLDRAKAHRNLLLTSINNKVGKNVILPFLPQDVNAHLAEMYKRVEMYIDRRQDYLSIVDAHARAIREIERLIKVLEANRTLYGEWLLVQVGRKSLQLVTEDFNSNKATQPAHISVEARDSKKYPFHIVGQNIDLAFNLKNDGPGYAYDINLTVLCDEGITLGRDEIEVGSLAPTSMQLIEIPAIVTRECKEVYVLLRAVWNNFDHTACQVECGLTIRAQKSDVDWDALSQTDPYSLDPVLSESELIGRKDLLNRLIATFKATSVGSSIVEGQKRVGKTSLAKALQSHLEGLDYMVLYREAGDYSYPEAKNAVAALGIVLCNGIINQEPKTAHLPVPEFTVALSPLAEFLDRVSRILPNLRLVFVLDEFDELSVNLYERGTVGDAFFLTLRSLSSRPGIGFVLVGGEKMRHIMESQGDKMNKWNIVSVDYFTRESDWTDYCDLIQRPVPQLEYANDSLILLHELTAGNPYFTKLICKHIFLRAIARRDCHITRGEVDEATDVAIRETRTVVFQHFWEDGIIDAGAQKAERSIRRRKVLIAVSDVLGKQLPAPRKQVAKHQLVHNMETIENELREFVNRKILVEQGDAYTFKVPLFARWLKGRGVQELIVTSPEIDASLKQRQLEEDLRIKSKEIEGVLEKWGVYRGQDISERNVREWLDQFGDVAEQRAVFPILQHVRFYTDGFIKKKLMTIHDFVKQGTIHTVERGKQKRSDILVTYMENSSTNGFNLARKYIDEASIYVGNIVERSKLQDVLKQKQDIKALVYIVDFVDTADFACKDLISLDAAVGDIVKSRRIRMVYAAILGFETGWDRIVQTIEGLQTPIHPFACELLDHSAMCFGEESEAFPDPGARKAARGIVHGYGKVLKSNWPLGYGDLGFAIVFERGCPNTSLPVLWAESRANAWVPLFKTEHSLESKEQPAVESDSTSIGDVMRSKNFQTWAGSTKSTFAIIFTDIVGSTVIARTLGNEAMKEVRRRHFKKARTLIYKNGGNEIKTIGDSFMVAFRTAVDAFDFALALHGDTGDDLVRVRAGIHVGPADIEDEDAFGQMVDYASRVGSMAKGPEIWVSNSAKDHIDQEKARRHTNLVWTSHPNCELKGVEGPQLLWSVTATDASLEGQNQS